jgi:muramidase (phage lysozyme)
VQAGAGPAAVAAARAADTAPAGLSAKERKAFLNTIATGESPGGAYDYIIGGGKITDFSKHPRQMGSAGKYGSSDAAGKYQFLGSTWDEQSKKYGYKDFKPETQDTAAWNYAKDVYKQKSGRELEADLKTGDPQILNNISTTLGQTWTSLPGGSQPNDNWKGKDFASVYKANLGSDVPNDPTPNVGSGQSDYDTQNAAPAADTNVSTYDAANKIASGSGDKNYSKDVGDIFSGFGDLMAKGPVAQNAARPTGSGIINMPQPMPQGVTPTVDPRVADAQRQQLALALQRLNSGRLV